jgi:CheY-like chemotaxis protein
MSSPNHSNEDELRGRIRDLLGKVTDLVAGKPGVDLHADLNARDELDSLALAIHLLRRMPGDSQGGSQSLPWAGLFEGAPEPQCIVAEEGPVVHVNRAWRRAFGDTGRMLAGIAVQSRLVEAWWNRRPRQQMLSEAWTIDVELRGATGGSRGGRLLAWPDPDGRFWQVSAQLSAPVTMQEPKAARRRRILVVDDDPSVRSVTSELLEACGYACQQLPGGPEALALFEHERPDIDLLLIDMQMPKVSGREVVERLGARLQGIPIVFMTGFLDPEHAAQLQARHGAHVLRKPFALTDLIATLELALGGGSP